MLESIPCENYLNPKNSDLFSIVSKTYNIELYKILDTEGVKDLSLWKMNFQHDTAKITYYEDTDSTASFTHELLHIYLIKKGFTDTSEFVLNDLNNNEIMHLIFNSTIGHIQNLFAHLKMFPKFIDLGYSEDEFTSDYYQTPKIKQVIDQIENNFNEKGLPNYGITCFCSSFYTIKDNRNKSNSALFEKLDKYLSQKDTDLYNILENNWSNWLADETCNNKPYIQEIFHEVTKWYKNRSANTPK